MPMVVETPSTGGANKPAQTRSGSRAGPILLRSDSNASKIQPLRSLARADSIGGGTAGGAGFLQPASGGQQGQGLASPHSGSSGSLGVPSTAPRLSVVGGPHGPQDRRRTRSGTLMMKEGQTVRVPTNSFRDAQNRLFPFPAAAAEPAGSPASAKASPRARGVSLVEKIASAGDGSGGSSPRKGSTQTPPPPNMPALALPPPQHPPQKQEPPKQEQQQEQQQHGTTSATATANVPVLHPLSLSFRDAELEVLFQGYIRKSVMGALRGFAAVLLAAWLAFLVVDASRERSRTRRDLLLYRCLTLPVFGAVLKASFSLTHSKWVDAVAQASIGAMLSLFLGSYLLVQSRLEATSLAVALCAWDMFVGVRFWSIVVLNAVLFLEYQLIALTVPGRELWPLDLFFLACVLVGLGVSRAHCRFQRSAFLAALSSAGQQISFHEQQTKAENLLLNVLPGPVAMKLANEGPAGVSERFDSVTILFADIVGFNRHAAKLKDGDVVRRLNRIISSLDILTNNLGVEKIKTISTVYLAAGGLPTPYADHTFRVARLALQMQYAAEILSAKKVAGFDVHLMIGLAVGPVVAGIIGTSKFAYDIWGDTVNTASRMESHGDPGRIQVTEAVYQELKNLCDFEERGEIEVKGKGVMTTYWLKGIADPNIADLDREFVTSLFDDENVDANGAPLVFVEQEKMVHDQKALATVLDLEELAEDLEVSLQEVEGGFPVLHPGTLLFPGPVEGQYQRWIVEVSTRPAALWALLLLAAVVAIFFMDIGKGSLAWLDGLSLGYLLLAVLLLAVLVVSLASGGAGSARVASLLLRTAAPLGVAAFCGGVLAHAASVDAAYPLVAFRLGVALGALFALPVFWFVFKGALAAAVVVAYAAVFASVDALAARPEINTARETVALFMLVAAGTYASFLSERHARQQWQLISALSKQDSLLQLQLRETEKIIESSIPKRIAAELKADQMVFAEGYLDATILFSDIVSFTVLSSKLEPREIVDMLNKLFVAFDTICEENGLEKIKTIGDAYVAVGFPGRCAEDAIVKLGLGMQRVVARLNAEGSLRFPVAMRIGIAAGPIIGGVIGRVRTFYDVWGQSLKNAERLEQTGTPDRVHVDESFKERIEEAGWQFERSVSVKIDDNITGKRKEVPSYLVIDPDAPARKAPPKQPSPAGHVASAPATMGSSGHSRLAGPGSEGKSTADASTAAAHAVPSAATVALSTGEPGPQGTRAPASVPQLPSLMGPGAHGPEETSGSAPIPLPFKRGRADTRFARRVTVSMQQPSAQLLAIRRGQGAAVPGVAVPGGDEAKRQNLQSPASPLGQGRRPSALAAAADGASEGTQSRRASILIPASEETKARGPIVIDVDAKEDEVAAKDELSEGEEGEDANEASAPPQAAQAQNEPTPMPGLATPTHAGQAAESSSADPLRAPPALVWKGSPPTLAIPGPEDPPAPRTRSPQTPPESPTRPAALAALPPLVQDKLPEDEAKNKPDLNKPDVNKTDVDKPEANKPDANKPDINKPDGNDRVDALHKPDPGVNKSGPVDTVYKSGPVDADVNKSGPVDAAVPKSSDPVNKSSDPVNKPSDPVNKSSDPVHKPSDPVNKSSDPVNKPSDPVHKPSDPIDVNKQPDPVDNVSSPSAAVKHNLPARPPVFRSPAQSSPRSIEAPNKPSEFEVLLNIEKKRYESHETEPSPVGNDDDDDDDDLFADLLKAEKKF